MGPHGQLHHKHVNLIKKALRKVFDGMPATKQPHDGDVDVAFVQLFPILKDLFAIPSSRDGDDAGYNQYLMDNPLKADFHQLVKNPRLLAAWIAEMEAVGTKDGIPREIQVDYHL